MNDITQQLIEIYDELLGCETIYGFTPLLRGAKREQAEAHIIRQLNKLAILANNNNDLKHLIYYVEEALDTFDIQYILDELSKIID